MEALWTFHSAHFAHVDSREEGETLDSSHEKAQGHEWWLLTSDTTDFESSHFSESSRESLPRCWHDVYIELDCLQI